MMFAKYRCASCDLAIHGTHADPICHSSVYGAKHVLCKNCSQHEEEVLEETGTNYQPRLLQRYNAPKYDYNPYDDTAGL